MPFIRIKKINNQEYAYLIENVWTANGSRQGASKYLGKICNIEKKDVGLANKITGSNYKEIITNLIKQELNRLKTEEIKFNNSKITKKNKEIVLKLNEGFMCNYSISRLIDFQPTEINKAKEFANLLLEAGIKLSQQEFIELCEKIFPQEKEEEIEKIEEFYY